MLVIVLLGIILFIVMVFMVSFGEEKQVAAVKIAEFDLVIARYQEKLSWLHDKRFDQFTRIFVYNKGSSCAQSDLDIPEKLKNRIHYQELPNVGRESHTYLHHMIKHWRNLGNVTLFVPASCSDQAKQWRVYSMMDKMFRSKNTVLQGFRQPQGVARAFYDFTLDEWASTNKQNFAKNSERKLLEAPIRPLGAWYTQFIGDPDKSNTVMTYHGIFAVSRDHITQTHGVEFYKELLAMLSTHSNPEVGHYMERCFSSIFGEETIPESCIYYE